MTDQNKNISNMTNDELEKELNNIKKISDNFEYQDSKRIKTAKTLRNIAIANLCIIPIIFTFGILLFVQAVLVLIHKGKEENQGLKIAAGICTFFFLIIGSIITLIYANKEIKE